MKLRLADGSEYALQNCKQECDPETGDNVFICALSEEYDFNELTKILKKDNISEILSVLDENGFVFQSTDYKSVKLISKDIKTNTLTLTFINKEC